MAAFSSLSLGILHQSRVSYLLLLLLPRRGQGRARPCCLHAEHIRDCRAWLAMDEKTKMAGRCAGRRAFFSLCVRCIQTPPRPRCINCSRAASQYSIKGFWVRRKTEWCGLLSRWESTDVSYSLDFRVISCFWIATQTSFFCLFVCLSKEIRPQRTKLPLLSRES